MAENLLDFSDDAPNDGQPSGLAATTVLASTPAAANLLAGTSSNPLDDLVSIFGSTSFAPSPAPAAAAPTPLAMNGFGAGFGAPAMTPSALTPSPMQPQVQPQAQAQSGQDDLLGLF